MNSRRMRSQPAGGSQPGSSQPAVGRLAFRVEGAMWNCYWAQHGTMEHSTLLGSMSMRLAENPELKELFMSLMRVALADVIRDITGGEVAHWFEEQAPEHERSGQG